MLPTTGTAGKAGTSAAFVDDPSAAALCGCIAGGLEENDGAVVAGGVALNAGAVLVCGVAGAKAGAPLESAGAAAEDDSAKLGTAGDWLISSSAGIVQSAMSAGNCGSVSLIFM